MPPEKPLRIFLDEDIPARLRAELERRGYRDPASAQSLCLKGSKDRELLRGLADRGGQWVLVTGDQDFPHTCRALITADYPAHVSLAVVAPPRAQDGLSEDEHRRDVVHRWVHLMIHQQTGTAFRYTRRARRRLY